MCAIVKIAVGIFLILMGLSLSIYAISAMHDYPPKSFFDWTTGIVMGLYAGGASVLLIGLGCGAVYYCKDPWD
jgi:hypothetical protein